MLLLGVKEIRERLGLTQKEMAYVMGYSFRGYQEVEVTPTDRAIKAANFVLLEIAHQRNKPDLLTEDLRAMVDYKEPKMAKQTGIAAPENTYLAKDSGGKSVTVGNKGYIDEDRSIRVIVTAVIYRTSAVLFEINYFNEGICYTLNIEAWRFSKLGD